MKILKKVNFSLKETINSESATTVLNTLANQQIKICGLLIGTKDDVEPDSGEIMTIKIGVLKTIDNELISTISPTAIGSIETIIDAYESEGILNEIEEGITVNVKSSKSAKNREFFHLELI